jgi:hypothetical protein
MKLMKISKFLPKGLMGKKLVYLGAIILFFVVVYAYFFKRREGFEEDTAYRLNGTKDCHVKDWWKNQINPKTKKKYKVEDIINNTKMFQVCPPKAGAGETPKAGTGENDFYNITQNMTKVENIKNNCTSQGGGYFEVTGPWSINTNYNTWKCTCDGTQKVARDGTTFVDGVYNNDTMFAEPNVPICNTDPPKQIVNQASGGSGIGNSGGNNSWANSWSTVANNLGVK